MEVMIYNNFIICGTELGVRGIIEMCGVEFAYRKVYGGGLV